MDKLYEVTFIEGEDVCRMDGELTTDEWWENKCGIVGEIEFGEGWVMKDDILYTKPNITLFDILGIIGTYHPPEKEYDRISNSGYGEISAMTRKGILGTKGSFVINADNVKGLKIKPYKEFTKDYPKFNEKEYTKLMNSLDAYYIHMNNESRKKLGLP